MTKDTTRQYVNLLAALLALIVNILSNALPLNGLNTGQISDRFQVYFVPAGYVFSIWGIIYIGWIAFVIFQLRPSQKESPRLRALDTGSPSAASSTPPGCSAGTTSSSA